MSKKIKERTQKLASREAKIKQELFGKSGKGKSKASKIGKTALVGGIITLLLFAIYKSFFQEDKKPKKGKRAKAKSGAMAEKLIAFILPYLAEFLTSFLSTLQEKRKNKEDKQLDEKEESDKSEGK